MLVWWINWSFLGEKTKKTAENFKSAEFDEKNRGHRLSPDLKSIQIFQRVILKKNYASIPILQLLPVFWGLVDFIRKVPILMFLRILFFTRSKKIIDSGDFQLFSTYS